MATSIQPSELEAMTTDEISTLLDILEERAKAHK